MKILVILPLVTVLSACSMLDRFKSNKDKVIVEDIGQNEVGPVVGEQASFEWNELDSLFSKLEVMPEESRKKAVKELEASGVNFSLYFSYDGTKVSDKGSQEVDKHIQFMQDNPTVRLRLEGHADARGTREYNLALGENRALNVKKAISVSGDIGKRIEVVSYGEENPQSEMDNEAGWQKNRRVEFVYQ
ncbi:Tol-Pal system peptidoglycan-associated lipoprotein PAL [uncultured Gammaproteobacteria bacterium]|nr:Tol-Pal system peptidoglycan-associated lipoprotein PAL [uncultured Gammaproteobacteria bacterium]CAC9625397.1 Tol-Pal system peptidoglycan-associated lipoprotein PAL [uncultured Gammaproteobacteria bacterium]